MAKPLGLASEAELSTSPCERHRNVDDGFSVKIALAHANLYRETIIDISVRADTLPTQCVHLSLNSTTGTPSSMEADGLALKSSWSAGGHSSVPK